MPDGVIPLFNENLGINVNSPGFFLYSLIQMTGLFNVYVT